MSKTKKTSRTYISTLEIWTVKDTVGSPKWNYRNKFSLEQTSQPGAASYPLIFPLQASSRTRTFTKTLNLLVTMWDYSYLPQASVCGQARCAKYCKELEQRNGKRWLDYVWSREQREQSRGLRETGLPISPTGLALAPPPGKTNDSFLYTCVRAQWIEFNNSPTRCDLFSLLHFCRQLYMFRVLTPIIRSWYSCNYSFW